MIIAPHWVSLPTRAIGEPLHFQSGEPVTIGFAPWIGQAYVSPTRAIGEWLQVQFGEPVIISPPWEPLSPMRAIGLTITKGRRPR